jgi:capsular exopolysaccharide synthesis family protein
VSSPNAGEGKTTSVCNLGVAFAEIGRRVLVIDADFRKPRLHEIFNVVNDAGLLNLLSDGDTRRPADIDHVIRKTTVPGLSVLTAGSTSVPLPTLLHSDRFSKLLGRLRTQYDLILIDSAPLLVVPESRILARCTDGLVLVLRAGVTTPEYALAARKRALEDRTPLIGTILNDWKPDPAQYYSYYYSDKSA